MSKTINDITIEDMSAAAQENSDKYIDRAKKIAQQAFNDPNWMNIEDLEDTE